MTNPEQWPSREDVEAGLQEDRPLHEIFDHVPGYEPPQPIGPGSIALRAICGPQQLTLITATETIIRPYTTRATNSQEIVRRSRHLATIQALSTPPGSQFRLMALLAQALPADQNFSPPDRAYARNLLEYWLGSLKAGSRRVISRSPVSTRRDTSYWVNKIFTVTVDTES